VISAGRNGIDLLRHFETNSKQEFGMDAVSDPKDVRSKKYTTPRWVQVWFLQKSRDNWKKKYQRLKADAKRAAGRVSDLTRSRQTWRRRAEELETEVAVLREQAAEKK
jgi:hypothetical protein